MASLQDNYLSLFSLERIFETACWLGLEDCLQLSRELFKKWTAHPETAIPPQIENAVLCSAVALGSDKDWDFLFNLYINTTEEEDESRRRRLVHAMSCSKDPWILNRFMEYAITAVPSNFSETNIIVVVATSEVGRYIAKDFLMDNWVAVTESPSPSPLLQQYFAPVWNGLAGCSSACLREDRQYRSAGHRVAALLQYCVGGAPEGCGSSQITGNEDEESAKQEENCQGG